jgi:glutathione S-transferase
MTGKNEALNQFKSPEARAAAEYLLERFEQAPDWKTKLYTEGVLTDFQFRYKGEWWCSFDVRNHHLTFWFRPPAVKSGRWGFWKVQKFFNASDHELRKKDGEWILRVHNLEEAQNLAGIIKI